MYYQYFVSGGNVEDAVGTVGFFQVQTYGAENCMQGGPDDGRSLYPWVRWSCQSEGDCTTLPYNIVSKKQKNKQNLALKLSTCKIPEGALLIRSRRKASG